MAHSSTQICVVGSTNMDLFFRVPRLPRAGETLLGYSFQTGFGGKGANQAVMAARLGANVSMISRVGADHYGERSLANFQACGVDASHVLCDGEAPTGVAAIAVDDAAQNCIIVIPGANARLTPADIHGAAATIADAKLLIAQLEVPLETVQEALLLARRHELLTILNCAPAQPLADDLLKLVDVCVLNESELETLTGSKGETMHEVIAASWNLLGRGPRQVIVTLGSDGALVVDATSAEHVPGVPVSAVDSSGAGDAFIGSLAVWLAEGYDLTESARRANAVAALSVTRFGTQSSFPSRDEVTAFLRERAFAEE